MIFVTGSEGMLGKRIVNETAFSEYMYGWKRADCDYRDSAAVLKLFERVEPGDVIINCIGKIPEKTASNIEMIEANTIIPHVLAWAASMKKAWMFHISTDCVFGDMPRLDSERMMYRDADLPCPSDLYGRTKHLGEVDAGHVVNVRTSFIGPEHGLWYWFDSQPHGATVEGWPRHYWSGSTVSEVAEKLGRMARVQMGHSRLIFSNVIHLATNVPMSKAAVLVALRTYLQREDIRIHHNLTPYRDRSLQPSVDVPALELPTWLKAGRYTVND